MTSINEEERLEILNSGQHLGWANVVDGRWSYTHADLAPGLYYLSGRYKGKVSTTWTVNVKEAPGQDNLDGATSGYFQRDERPYFSVEETRGSAIGTGGGAGIKYEDMGSAYPGIRGNVLYLTCVSRDTLRRQLTVEVGFYKAYSAISFSCYIFRKVAPGAGPESSLNLFGEGGTPLRYINMMDYEAETHHTLVLSDLPRGRKIKSMRFDIVTGNDPLAQYRYDELLLDNFVLTP